MRRSRTETAETRERIVSTASKLFLEKGLGAVGTRDIMAAAELTRGAFYRHFDSKDQLIAEATGSASERLYLMLRRKTAGKPHAKALETIASIYLDQLQDTDDPYPCTLAVIGAELSHYDRKVRDIATSAYQHIVRLVAEHLPQQEEKEKLAIASGIVSTMVGAVTLAKIAPDRKTAKSILANAKKMVISGANSLVEA